MCGKKNLNIFLVPHYNRKTDHSSGIKDSISLITTATQRVSVMMNQRIELLIYSFIFFQLYFSRLVFLFTCNHFIQHVCSMVGLHEGFNQQFVHFAWNTQHSVIILLNCVLEVVIEFCFSQLISIIVLIIKAKFITEKCSLILFQVQTGVLFYNTDVCYMEEQSLVIQVLSSILETYLIEQFNPLEFPLLTWIYGLLSQSSCSCIVCEGLLRNLILENVV